MNAVMEDRPVWLIPERDLEAEKVLQDALDVPSLVAAVLVGRGYADPADAEAFLNPSLDQLHDPALLPDYEPAVAAILNAKDQGHTIYVHGDYDVDGVTSAALFTRFLKKVGCKVVPHVPHRIREGYGIHLDAVQWAKEHGTDLFLTCDCGISAHEQVRAANQAGMAVVVTDHHLVGDTLPAAVAVVNPHRKDSLYPWPELCGVGVAFKLCAGITRELGLKVEQFYRAYLDLAVLGTVADVMPLLDENRVITKFGLECLRESRKLGVQALLRVSDLLSKDKLTARHVGYQLGPRINAVGRIDDPAQALDLLLTDNPEEAQDLAKRLDQVNDVRRAEQIRSVEEATARVEEEGLHRNFTLVVSDENWHPGVIGLIAGRLVERYRRPAFVVSVADGVAKGSARSIVGFDLGAAIRSVRPMLTSGGGHEMAAGFSLKAERLGDLSDALEALARQQLCEDDFARKVAVDAEVSAREADASVCPHMARLEPYGTANCEPVFLCRGAKISSIVPTSSPEHARVALETDGGPRGAMVFGFAEELERFAPGEVVDVAFTLEENVYNGSKAFRWVLQDVQSSA